MKVLALLFAYGQTWPLLYETPLGMVCLYGKVMVSASSIVLLTWIFVRVRDQKFGAALKQGQRPFIRITS